VKTNGVHTLQEIRTQPDAWAAVLDAAREGAQSWGTFFAQRAGDQTLFFGCGSTYYLSLTAASVFQTLAGRAARGVPAAELFLFPETWVPGDCAVCGIAVSRSGTTTETIRAADHLTETYDAQIAVVTCYNDTPLGERSSITLVSPKGYEESVAQTRSFSSMLVGSIALAALAGGQVEYVDKLAALPDETRQEVMANLETIRKAIDEINRALAEQPDNVLLQELLRDSYREELDLMIKVDGVASAAMRRGDI